MSHLLFAWLGPALPAVSERLSTLGTVIDAHALPLAPSLPLALVLASPDHHAAGRRVAADHGVPLLILGAAGSHSEAYSAGGERLSGARLTSDAVDELVTEVLALHALDTWVEPVSPSMKAVADVVRRAAATATTMLLRGESGTGKGVLAAKAHAWSARPGPFVVVDCPTLSEPLLASELFGHARGAFTSAHRDKPGKVEVADRGTLFLDEVGELPAGVQSQLLRFLQDHTFERVGETKPRRSDVRVIAATNRDLTDEVKRGRFRLDLYYRLSVIDVVVPPLRERREDIAPLARRIVARAAVGTGRPRPVLGPAGVEELERRTWQGNVRELENELTRAVVLSDGPVLDAALLRGAASERAVPRVGGHFTLDELERQHIVEILAKTRTLDEAARILGIDASTLWRKRRRLRTESRPAEAASVVSETPTSGPSFALHSAGAAVVADASGLVSPPMRMP